MEVNFYQSRKFIMYIYSVWRYANPVSCHWRPNMYSVSKKLFFGTVYTNAQNTHLTIFSITFMFSDATLFYLTK